MLPLPYSILTNKDTENVCPYSLYRMVSTDSVAVFLFLMMILLIVWSLPVAVIIMYFDGIRMLSFLPFDCWPNKGLQITSNIITGLRNHDINGLINAEDAVWITVKKEGCPWGLYIASLTFWSVKALRRGQNPSHHHP